MPVDLGELLVAHQKLADADLQRARRVQEGTGENLDSLLIKLGLVSERDLAEALSTQLNLPLVHRPADYPGFRHAGDQRWCFRALSQGIAGHPLVRGRAGVDGGDGQPHRRLCAGGVATGDR